MENTFNQIDVALNLNHFDFLEPKSNAPNQLNSFVVYVFELLRFFERVHDFKLWLR